MIINVPELKENHFKNTKFFRNRVEMLSILPSKSIGVELGVFKGDFSKHILEKVNPDKLILIDIKFSDDMNSLFKSQISSNQVTVMEGDSVENLEKFPDEYFDWIYIDGNHSMNGAQRDTNIAKSKIKNEGIIIFNDYKIGDHNTPNGFFPYGVIHAANNLCIEDDFEMVGFAFHPQMYCDVALKRI